MFSSYLTHFLTAATAFHHSAKQVHLQMMFINHKGDFIFYSFLWDWCPIAFMERLRSILQKQNSFWFSEWGWLGRSEQYYQKSKIISHNALTQGETISWSYMQKV